MDKGLQELANDDILRKTFKIKEEEIQKLESLALASGMSRKKEEYVTLLFSMRGKS